MFSYLNGCSWAEVTRDERFFCQRLYSLIVEQRAAKFVDHINGATGAELSLDAQWEPAFEACFYRDLWHFRSRSGELVSPKRTFDLMLLSEDCIVIIEAKAQQAFGFEQLRYLSSVDCKKVRELTGVSSVLFIGLASSKYQVPSNVLAAFDGLLTWRELSDLYGRDSVLLRADEVYEPQQSETWGKNNQGGYMTGEALVEAYLCGKRFFVGRAGGFNGSRFAKDVGSGSWRTQRYETSSAITPPNRNWFKLEEFAMLVLERTRHSFP